MKETAAGKDNCSLRGRTLFFSYKEGIRFSKHCIIKSEPELTNILIHIFMMLLETGYCPLTACSKDIARSHSEGAYLEAWFWALSEFRKVTVNLPLV